MANAENPKAVKGDNSAHVFAKEQLKTIIQRIEKLEDEKTLIGDDIKDVYAEAKGNGYDTKVLRTIIKLRKLDTDERIEHDTILHAYMVALGMDVFS